MSYGFDITGGSHRGYGRYFSNPIPALGPAAYYQYATDITLVGFSVSQWNDQSGNGRHLTQATPGQRPLFQLDGSILFDGVDDYLRAVFAALTQPCTNYYRFYIPSAGYSVNDTIFDGGNVFQGWCIATGINPRYVVSAGVSLPQFDMPLDTWASMVVVFDGVSSLAEISGGPSVAGNAGAVNPGGVTLGARNFGASPSLIYYKEAVMFNGAHNATTRNSVLSYLNTL